MTAGRASAFSTSGSSPRRIAQRGDQRLVDLVRLARRHLHQVEAGAGHQEVLTQRTPRCQFNKVALAKAIVADHRQHVAAPLAAAVERAVERHSFRLQADGECLGVLHRHDADAQRLQGLARTELVGVQRNARQRLGQGRRRCGNRRVRLGGELLRGQAEAPPGGKEHLPLVAAHVGLEQFARAKMWMMNCLRRHKRPRQYGLCCASASKLSASLCPLISADATSTVSATSPSSFWRYHSVTSVLTKRRRWLMAR